MNVLARQMLALAVFELRTVPISRVEIPFPDFHKCVRKLVLEIEGASDPVPSTSTFPARQSRTQALRVMEATAQAFPTNVGLSIRFPVDPSGNVVIETPDGRDHFLYRYEEK